MKQLRIVTSKLLAHIMEDDINRVLPLSAKVHPTQPNIRHEPRYGEATVGDTKSLVGLRRGRSAAASTAVEPEIPAPGAAHDWCAVVLSRASRDAHFEIVASGTGAQRRVVARSSSFRMLGSRVHHRGKPRAAHELLVTQLVASGWRRVKSRGRWHDTVFVRPRADSQTPQIKRALIKREDRFGLAVARFHADELDAFGNGTRLADSPRFATLPRESLVRPSDEAMDAHNALVNELRSAGWTVVGSVGPEWYAQVLEKPT